MMHANNKNHGKSYQQCCGAGAGICWLSQHFSVFNFSNHVYYLLLLSNKIWFYFFQIILNDTMTT